MFDIIIDKKILNHCIEQLKKYNFGQRGYADGNKEQQFTGLVGQSVIARLFGSPLPTGEKGFDQGEDLKVDGKIIDVKTMGRTTKVRDYYVNNFIGLQKDYKTDVFIFCSFNKSKNTLTVCGWITKNELFEKAEFFPKGSQRTRSDGTDFTTFADLYEIKNSDIHDVNSFAELKKSIKKLRVT